MRSRFLPAIFLQFMGTVGSGIFVLPYLFYHSNFIFASIFLVFLTIVTAALNHFYVEIVSNTSGDHQLAGYAAIYLGKRFKLLAILNLFLLAFGAITAYSKLFSSFLTLLIPSSASISNYLYLLVLSLLFFYNQKLTKNIFRVIPIFMIVVPLLLFVYSLSSYKVATPEYIFPNFAFFGATLFALTGFTIIPEVRQILGTKRWFSSAVLCGLLLASIIYFIYSFSLIKLSGSFLSVDSLSGLYNAYPLLALLLAVFGMVITIRASFNFMLILHEIFYRDLHLSSQLSSFLPLIFPILALMLKTISLITVISLTGHFTIFISALIICLIRLRLPHTFSTQFFCLLIMLSLLIGLSLNLF